MRKSLTGAAGALLLLGLALLTTGAPAHGGESWEWDDPVVHVNGRVVRVLVGVPAEARANVVMANLTVAVPADAEATVVGVAAPRFPLTVNLIRSGESDADGVAPVTATLVVTGADGFDVALRFEQPDDGRGIGTATIGRSNQPVSATHYLPARSNRGVRGAPAGR
ncbi:MAG: hypothetical protein U0531_19780 [Dehalococcoidia bacterium]